MTCFKQNIRHIGGIKITVQGCATNDKYAEWKRDHWLSENFFYIRRTSGHLAESTVLLLYVEEHLSRKISVWASLIKRLRPARVSKCWSICRENHSERFSSVPIYNNILTNDMIKKVNRCHHVGPVFSVKQRKEIPAPRILTFPMTRANRIIKEWDTREADKCNSGILFK